MQGWHPRSWREVELKAALGRRMCSFGCGAKGLTARTDPRGRCRCRAVPATSRFCTSTAAMTTLACADSSRRPVSKMPAFSTATPQYIAQVCPTGSDSLGSSSPPTPSCRNASNSDEIPTGEPATNTQPSALPLPSWSLLKSSAGKTVGILEKPPIRWVA